MTPPTDDTDSARSPDTVSSDADTTGADAATVNDPPSQAGGATSGSPGASVADTAAVAEAT
jgi:hypothetical protein